MVEVMVEEGGRVGWGRRCIDILTTLVLWGYFTVGFVLFFSPFYAVSTVFSKNREAAFQLLNHYFYRGFFGLIRLFVPRTRWQVDDEARRIRSAVVVCNHRSYLDPLLLISLFKKHKTVVKARFFKMPIFGWMMRHSGYLPSGNHSELADILLNQVDKMPDFLAQGGILFVFPEGTRRRSNRSGALNKGAFTIAKRCRAPLVVLQIRNSEKLFRPGKFLFDTGTPNCIEVKHIAEPTIDYDEEGFSLNRLKERIQILIENENE